MTLYLDISKCRKIYGKKIARDLKRKFNWQQQMVVISLVLKTLTSKIGLQICGRIMLLALLSFYVKQFNHTIKTKISQLPPSIRYLLGQIICFNQEYHKSMILLWKMGSHYDFIRSKEGQAKKVGKSFIVCQRSDNLVI